MTLYEVCQQLHNISVGGYFNHEKFTLNQLHSQCKRMFDTGSTQLVYEIALPDGWWYFTINKYGAHGFDYTIPETRAQEAHIKKILHHS